MKYLVFVSLISGLASLSYSSPTRIDPCNDIHTGEFYYYPKTSNRKYKIIREGNTQTEITLSTNDTAVYKISWINDCSFMSSHLSGGVQYPEGAIRPLFYTQIVTLTNDYYLFKMCKDSMNSNYCMSDTVWRRPRPEGE
jgi:hypothetical protein